MHYFSIRNRLICIFVSVRRSISYLILVGLAFVIGACNIKRNVPDNRYLLVKNEVNIPKVTEVDKGKIENVIRQRTNHRTLGLRLKLRIYNSVDSTKVVESKQRRYRNYLKKNKKLLARQERINEKRIQNALKRGDTLYSPKRMDFKDTLDPRPTLRERIKYSWGEAPVIYDSSATITSKSQIKLFMQKSGYFDAEVFSKVKLDTLKREASVKYNIVPKKPYYVDSMFLNTKNKNVRAVYVGYLEEGKDVLKLPFRFDSEDIAKMRRSMAEYMRQRGLYGFKESYVSFEVDTLGGGHNIQMSVDVSKRIVGKDENEREKPFEFTRIHRVTFHLLDTMSFKGNFQKEKLDPINKTLKPFELIPTYDTLVYDWYEGKNPQFRKATFLYNGRLTSKPELIEFQNYLEENNFYSGEYLPQSYNRLMNLNIFKTIKPEIIENDDNSINVHYYLTPQKRRSFSFEPKGTNNNSYLGVSASLNYVNRNMFRRGYQFKASLSGGFESQPEVFGKNDDGAVLQDGTRSLNTVEFGPSFELEMPGLVPVPLTKLSKRQNPKTSLSLAYNYQKRPEFTRQIYQFKYLWKFSDISRQQVFTVGIPLIGGIQFVNIKKTEPFENRLKEQNDLFLLNAYSNQAVFKDLGVTYGYTNSELKDGNLGLSYRGNLDVAGMLMSLITIKKQVNDEGYKEFLGQKYSQFARIDNQLVLSQRLDDRKSLHYRLQIGLGIPFLNNGPNLPFDYSFSGGGSNDNRGFSARTLGPGIYKSYLDSATTYTQIGDMRLGASLEYRFKITKLFEGAVFSDAGNVWTYNEDPNRPGGEFTKDFYKQLSVSAGIGLRLDFTFLIIRVDMGFPVRNPMLPKGARWIFQSRDSYIQEGIDQWGINPDTGDYFYKTMLPRPFKPHLHVAIGYPF